MMEHEMCCGTTCDKQQVAAEVEKLKQERDEAMAYAERFKSVVEAVANIGVDFGYGAYEIQADIIDFARVILSEQPPAALAALKAEVVESFLCGLNSLDIINIHNRRPDARVEWFRKRAQEAK